MKRRRPAEVTDLGRKPLGTYAYWPERYWQTGEAGFVVIAPSGERLTWHASEASAVTEVELLRREGP